MKTRLIWMALAAAPTAAFAQEASPPKPAPAPTSKPAGHTVGEVVVTGQAPAVQTSIDRRSYSVSGDLQAQSGPISDALRNLPSVEVDVQGNVSLRGDPNVTILIDGKPSSLFTGDNKAQALQSMPADSIERVEVITNPSAEFRADGSAGIINLITKQARGAGRTGSLRLTAGEGDRYAAGASGGYNSNKLTAAADVGMRQDTQKSHGVDDRLQRDPATGGFDAIDQDQVTHIIANSFNGRASVDYDLSPKTRIGAETHANYTFFRVDAPSRFTADGPTGALSESFDRQLNLHQKRLAAEVSANLRHKFEGDGELVVSLSHEGINDDRVRSGRTSDQVPAAPDAFDQQRLDNHLQRTELKGDFTQPLPDMAKLKLGFDVEYVDNAYRNRGFVGGAPDALAPDATLTNLFVFKQTVSAAYVTYERPLGALTVLAGLRVEDVQMHLDQATLGQSDENDYLRAYPSLHLAWKLSDAQQLTTSYSHRVQRPDPGEFNAFRLLLDPLNFRAGNPHLKPQQTQSFELGYEYRRSPVLLLATLYYRENRDGVADVLRDLGGGVFLSERDNVARSRSGGLELVANGRLTKTVTYNLNGGLGWSQLDSLGPTFAPTRSLVSPSGHGSLTWQAAPDDLLQLNGFMVGKRLTPQGHADPMIGVDLGYRHKLSDRLSVAVTAQDILGTFRAFQAIDTPVLRERTKTDFDTRQIRVGLTWTLGGGRQKEPTFDFQGAPSTP
ncbi:MAG: TonB-dependent receptor [Phenylobacterium sp.]|nr:TonB-dependent receptor [Phenylobacterium sp.]